MVSVKCDRQLTGRGGTVLSNVQLQMGVHIAGGPGGVGHICVGYSSQMERATLTALLAIAAKSGVPLAAM